MQEVKRTGQNELFTSVGTRKRDEEHSNGNVDGTHRGHPRALRIERGHLESRGLHPSFNPEMMSETAFHSNWNAFLISLRLSKLFD